MSNPDPFAAEYLPAPPESMNPEDIEIVKSCVSLLEAGGEALTTHFYNLMMSSESVVRPYFNQAHQKDGSQPRALAFSVLCVAKHIDTLTETLASPFGTSLISTIVTKHLAVQVKPCHYPIVGKYLLQSIREVLGADVATDRVIEAWGRCYGVLAHLLIVAEHAGYGELYHAEGGWAGQREFILIDKQPANKEKTAFSYTLRSADEKSVLTPKAGQYLTLRINDPEAKIDTTRNYSISNLTVQGGNTYRFTSQTVLNGMVSNYLNTLPIGAKLQVHPPTGEFVLRDHTIQDSERPALFIAAGSGVTPFISQIQSLRKTNPNQKITLLQIAHNEDREILAEETNALEKDDIVVKKFYTEHQPLHQGENLPTDLYINLLKEHVNAPAENIYVVGPKGFMLTTQAALTGEQLKLESKINYEFFGPRIFF